jgi:dipeptidyl-peptidase-4
MKRFGILLSLLLVITSSLVQAQKKDISLNDAIVGARAFYGERLYGINWLADSDKYSQYDIKGSILIKDINGNTLNEITAEQINENAAEELKVERAPYSIKWLNDNEFTFNGENSVLKYSIKERKLSLLYNYRAGAANFDYNKDASMLAYTIDNNLYLAGVNGEMTITDDAKDSDIVNGQAVHRVEFGITKGIFWSPKGNMLAYYRKDESMVKDYPIVDVMAREAELKAIKYPMAGMTSEQVKLIIFNPKNGQKIEVQTGEPKEQFLTNIAWGPEQKYIYIAVLNRDQNHMKLNQYKVSDGSFVKTLFEEKSEQYVEPQHAMQFIPGRKNQFLWRSERDGFDHIYRYNTDGKLLNQVTKGDWIVADVFGVDKNYVYFTASDNTGLDRVIYKSRVTNSRSKKLSNVGGTHRATISSSKKYILDTWEDLDNPNVISIIKASNGKLVSDLHKSSNPLGAFNIGNIELGQITAADGKTVLNYRTVYPADFDQSKKYPALVYVYNGPHAQLVTNSWLGGMSMWMAVLANKGYIVYTLDGRGSFGRGAEFERVIYRNLGDNEMKDQIKGVEYLKSLPYVDGNRIAVHGWSYGGFMTTNLMTTYPEVFTTGVAGGPVIDWKWYEVMYGERYMDRPEENPEGYASSSLLHKAKNLEGKLMLIHGDEDPTVVMQHSLRFLKACVNEGVQVDFFVYPTHEHNVRGIDRVHLMQKVINYVIENNK